MLTALRAAWRRYPDMRLGQLIGNAAGVTVDDPGTAEPYFVEDDLLLEGLRTIATGVARTE